jgi:large subunit ribosomal protein L24
LVAGHLSKELRKKYKKRTFGLRRGDSVKILKGKFKGKSGKVESILSKKNKIYVEGILIQKASGTKAKVAIDASNVVITDLYLEDKLRKKKLEGEKKEEKKKESKL